MQVLVSVALRLRGPVLISLQNCTRSIQLEMLKQSHDGYRIRDAKQEYGRFTFSLNAGCSELGCSSSIAASASSATENSQSSSLSFARRALSLSPLSRAPLRIQLKSMRNQGAFRCAAADTAAPNCGNGDFATEDAGLQKKPFVGARAIFKGRIATMPPNAVRCLHSDRGFSRLPRPAVVACHRSGHCGGC
jgi:hypothetical protein